MEPIHGSVEGMYGTAVPVDPPADAPPHAGVGPTWLITCPRRGTVWTQWQLAAVHLHAGEGLDAPKLQYPGATHELLVVALNPDQGTITATTPMPWAWLQPVNIAQQVTCDSDTQIVDLLSLLAQGVVHGVLDPETADAPTHVRASWHQCIGKTLAHLRGEHR